jgi:tRNA-specific 2-thiouridylase
MSGKNQVVVGMSGGVDSSVAAALLVEEGYEVSGMMLRLWSAPGMETFNRCCTPDAVAQARRVAELLEIPFQTVDARENFRQTVVETFIESYLMGLTPNPCLSCNRHVRWTALDEMAEALGAEHIATGHYARSRMVHDSHVQLLRGIDGRKDQSYVLHVLNQEQLSRSLFPLGEYTKPQIREMAHSFGLPAADTPDSQDLCFIGEGDYREFLRKFAPQVEKPGPILTLEGEEVGSHQGLAFYTIGQRKGLGISAPTPFYVIKKDLDLNALFVATADELGRDELTCRQVNWLSGAPPEEAFRAHIMIRYKSIPSWGTVTPLESERASVKFDASLRDITPGQAAVFYVDDVCFGGGIIELQPNTGV